MQIGKKVHALKIPFYVTSPSGLTMERFVYVYLIYGSCEICLIDAGVVSAEEVIFDYLRRTGRRISEITLIIQTHSHFDHIGATRAIKGETGCAVAVHPSEKAWIEDVELQARERPVPGFHSLVGGRVAVDRVLENGDVVDLGCGLKIQVFHTPGHSKGSLSLLLLGYMALFSGDAIPVVGEMPIYEDASASVLSLKKLRDIKGISHLLSSWDEPKKEAEAYRHIDAGLDYLQRIHEAVIEFAGGNPSPEPTALCRSVLGKLGLPPEAANPLVEKSLMSHLKMKDNMRIV
ncbi:MAG: MBL fold metallo-hydrolase [Nitrospiraceae bacterium]|nr:MBL fold metallo-hydrolase [Nitrospiraceae bacterium]